MMQQQIRGSVMGFVTLEGYIVRRATELAVGLIKADAPLPGMAPITFVPRSCCRDGDHLEEGDTDLEVYENIASDKNLDY